MPILPSGIAFVRKLREIEAHTIRQQLDEIVIDPQLPDYFAALENSMLATGCRTDDTMLANCVLYSRE